MVLKASSSSRQVTRAHHHLWAKPCVASEHWPLLAANTHTVCLRKFGEWCSGAEAAVQLDGKLQQLQANLAGPVSQCNCILADWLDRELVQLWPWRKHLVKEMMKVALCAAVHHGLAHGLDNMAILCFSGACWLVTAMGPPALHGAGWESMALNDLRRWTHGRGARILAPPTPHVGVRQSGESRQ